MTAPLAPASRDYAEGFVAEDDVVTHARSRAEQLGVEPVGSGVGATLRFLAAAVDARAVVEIGTGSGVSSIWLLRGMSADGVLTSVDVDAEHQRVARESLTEAGFTGARARLIPGAALDVLPRLTDGHYDLVFCDADAEEYPAYLDASLRLLRAGGVAAFDNALLGDRVADPAKRDASTTAVRELLRSVAERDDVVPLLLPVGDGLLVLQKR